MSLKAIEMMNVLESYMVSDAINKTLADKYYRWVIFLLIILTIFIVITIYQVYKKIRSRLTNRKHSREQSDLASRREQSDLASRREQSDLASRRE